jgi:hypothetical protein
VRLVRTWLYFVILFVVANRLRGGGVNSLFTAAQETLLLGLLWALMAPGVAGGAAARDVQTRMHQLVYTTPIRKADYLGGRFLAALGLYALILLAVPLGMLVDFLLPGGKPGIIGPFPPIAYFGGYGVLALPTAVIFTAVQFSSAALTRKAVVSYLATVLFCVGVRITAAVVTNVFHLPTLVALLDPTAPRKIMRGIPPVRRRFGFATHARQTGALAWTSFWAIAKSPAGLVLPAVAMLLVLLVPVFVKNKGVSLVPTTALVLSKLIAQVPENPRLPGVLIPLLIIYWAGELVWRERDAGMGEIADATAECGLRSRLHLARQRFTRPTAAVAAAGVPLIFWAGGFFLYNTEALTTSDRTDARQLRIWGSLG